MSKLPDRLQSLGRRSPLGILRVHKGRLPRHHALPSLLSWQIPVDAASAPSLEHAFLHQLLHVHEALYATSADPAWRALSGWRSRRSLGLPLPVFPARAENQDHRAYASADGLASPEEDFVTFGVAFLLGDAPATTPRDALACRAAEKLAYFARLFPGFHSPAALSECPASADGLLDDLVFIDPVTLEPIPMGPITPETVEGFELLYATPGVQDAAEIAGHLVLRVRLHNNPGAALRGVENPRDLVISFLADTGDEPLPSAADDSSQSCDAAPAPDPLRSIIQPLKGLSGGFLTVLDRQTLERTVKSYTVDQDRDLLRFRLELTRDQKRRLIERLYAAKRHYRTPYYFFDRNCGSVLVQVIGEGLGDSEVATFDPVVAPPNALVALLVRKGLATPVQPSFYSFRKTAQVAQELLRVELDRLRADASHLAWPTARETTSRDEAVRAAAYAKISRLVLATPETWTRGYRLASLGQESELAYRDVESRCEDITTVATETLRALQAALRRADPEVHLRSRIDVASAVAARYAPVEADAIHRGSPHTQLLPLYVGAGLMGAADSSAKGVVVARAALHTQDMGAPSRHAMQRATSVRLGEVALMARPTGHGAARVEGWQATALSIRKLKERLDRTPSYLEPEGQMGLGLTLLDFRQNPVSRGYLGQVARGELVFNLAASPLHDRYVFVSVGAGMMARETARGPQVFLSTPVRAEGLWTFDAQRLWQLRAHAELRPTLIAGRRGHDAVAGVGLDRRFPGPDATELVARLAVDLQEIDLTFGERPRRGGLLQLGLEWIRW